VFSTWELAQYLLLAQLFAVVKKPDIFSPINTGHGTQFSARAVFCRRPEDEHGGVLAP